MFNFLQTVSWRCGPLLINQLRSSCCCTVNATATEVASKTSAYTTPFSAYQCFGLQRKCIKWGSDLGQNLLERVRRKNNHTVKIVSIFFHFLLFTVHIFFRNLVYLVLVLCIVWNCNHYSPLSVCFIISYACFKVCLSKVNIWSLSLQLSREGQMFLLLFFVLIIICYIRQYYG